MSAPSLPPAVRLGLPQLEAGVGYDNKYGQVTTEQGTIGDSEPVVVFRAQDRLLPQVLDKYLDLCVAAGSPAHHLHLILETLSLVEAWQEEHATKIPSSDALAP